MSRGEVCVGAGVFVEERRDVREEVRRGVVGRWGGVCDILGGSSALSTSCEIKGTNYGMSVWSKC